MCTRLHIRSFIHACAMPGWVLHLECAHCCELVWIVWYVTGEDLWFGRQCCSVKCCMCLFHTEGLRVCQRSALVLGQLEWQFVVAYWLLDTQMGMYIRRAAGTQSVNELALLTFAGAGVPATPPAGGLQHPGPTSTNAQRQEQGPVNIEC
jgi:hypothetical protein